MYRVTATVTNKLGLHARPASDLSMKAKEFQSVVTISNPNAANPKPINAKYVVKIIACGFKAGDTIEITAEGEDEVEAGDALAALINGGFGE